jgi:hypothetical protein
VSLTVDAVVDRHIETGQTIDLAPLLGESIAGAALLAKLLRDAGAGAVGREGSRRAAWAEWEARQRAMGVDPADARRRGGGPG